MVSVAVFAGLAVGRVRLAPVVYGNAVTLAAREPGQNLGSGFAAAAAVDPST